MQVTRFLIHDQFIHCNKFSVKHFNEEEFFISRGMLFQMTGPEYERLSLKILSLGLTLCLQVFNDLVRKVNKKEPGKRASSGQKSGCCACYLLL